MRRGVVRRGVGEEDFGAGRKEGERERGEPGDGDGEAVGEGRRGGTDNGLTFERDATASRDQPEAPTSYYAFK